MKIVYESTQDFQTFTNAIDVAQRSHLISIERTGNFAIYTIYLAEKNFKFQKFRKKFRTFGASGRPTADIFFRF